MPAPRQSAANGGQQSLVARLNESANIGHKLSVSIGRNSMGLKMYFRSADSLQRQAREYRLHHNEEQLYVMLMRFVSLVVETVPRHPQFDKGDPTYQRLRKEVMAAFGELEHLKVNLELKEKAAAQALEETPFMTSKLPGTVPLSAGSVPELHWDTLQPPQMAPADSFPGEVDFFGQPLSRSAAPAPALPALPELPSSIKLRPASQATLSKHAILPSQSYSAPPREAAAAQGGAAAQRRPLYPEFAPPEQPPPPSSSIEAQLAGLDVGIAAAEQEQQAAWPTPSPYGELGLGPQEVQVASVPVPSGPPAPGDTCCVPPPEPGGQALPPPPPPPQQQQQQQLVVSEPPRVVEEVKRRQSIRDVHISVALMDEFMRYAISNTKRGIETCGILAGKLSAKDDIFTINALIIPKQTGTSDTVEMLNEEDLVEATESRGGLFTLGWIHTHPTQSCFLSSIDMHTHCNYQSSMDEAVAIVMAPRDTSKRVGIFRLSTPGGLELIQRCHQRGFHMHPPTETGQPIYELCNHVYLNPRIAYEVVDLR